MSRHPRYWLYRVGRGPSTYDSLGPVHLRLPDLGSPDGLPSQYRYLAKDLTFNAPEDGKLDWKTLPFTEQQARKLATRGWLVAKLEGHGDPRLPSEEKLLAAVTARRDEVLDNRSPVYPFLSPWGDYGYADLVRRYLRPGKTKKYRIEELPESELPFEGGLSEVPTMVESLKRLQRWLRKKGWRFHADGSAWEPSAGGRRRRFPGGLIRKTYRSLATQYHHFGRGGGIIPYLQEVLRPHVGELTHQEIETALRNHLRK